MAQYTGTFETGVDGNAISTLDTGSANAWNNIASTANATQTYSTGQKYGTLAQRVVTAAAPDNGYVEWNVTTLGSSLITHFARYYMFFPLGHNAAMIVVRGLDETGVRAWELLLNANMTISVRDAGGTVRGTSAGALATNQWIRLEWKVVHSTTAGIIECKVFNSADSGTPTETVTSSGSFSTGNRMERIRLGLVALGKANSTYYFDNVLVNDTGYPGPLVSASSAATRSLLGVGT